MLGKQSAISLWEANGKAGKQVKESKSTKECTRTLRANFPACLCWEATLGEVCITCVRRLVNCPQTPFVIRFLFLKGKKGGP